MNRSAGASLVPAQAGRFAGLAWLVAVVAALWPVWSWSVARFLDGSDEPWGIVAIGALAGLALRDRKLFGGEPRAGWLVMAALATCAAVTTAAWLPALLRGVFASLAVTAMLMSLRTDGRTLLPYLVLALLSLPILSSLQFYLGYPLRVVTAEASTWLLSAAGLDVQRSGSALSVNGALVIVDAPCAGIHMAWVAYFTASVMGAWLRLDARRFVLQSSCVGLIVIAANVLRNTVLVALEARPQGLSPGWHETTGIVVFTAVCAATVWQLGRGHTPRPPRAWRFGSTAGATQ
jgi:exosortase/archaeosortase family protein